METGSLWNTYVILAARLLYGIQPADYTVLYAQLYYGSPHW